MLFDAQLHAPEIAFAPEYLFTYEGANGSFADSFVLIMLDPDAPAPENASVANVLHFLAPGLHLSGNPSIYAPLKNSTPALADYLSPAPPSSSAPHR